MQSDQEPSSKGSTWMLAIILGLVVATVQEHVGGFFVGALLGVLLAQVLHLRTRTSKLHAELMELKHAASVRNEAEHAVAAPAPSREPSREIATAAPIRMPVEPSRPAPVATVASRSIEASESTSTAAPSQAASRMEPATPGAFEGLTRQFIDWAKGGNPLARLGILILFFGGAFLAKYAAENSLFPIELRFIAIAVGAFALLFIGWRLRARRAVYAQLLQGGGIAGLYLTVFAAASLYHLLPLSFALALMVVIALSAAVLAVAQNALSLAVIGTAGGFVAPLLVSTGSGNHIALFSYYALLNLGVFAIAWFRTWRVLNVLALVFTFSITGLWRATGYGSDDLFSADFFLVLFFLMFVAISVLNCLRQPPDLKGYVSGSLVFGLPIVAFSLHATLVNRIEYALALSALTLGAFYLGLAWTLLRTGRESFRLLVESFAALGVIFASLAVPLAFDTRTTAAMWAVEGAGLIWLGMRQDRKLARAFGTLLQAGAGIGYLTGLYHSGESLPLLNSAYIGALMLGLSALFTSYCFYRQRERLANYESAMELSFALWGAAWWLFAGLNEIDRFASTAAMGSALTYVALTAALLELTGARLKWRLPQQIALYLPATAAVVAVLMLIPGSHPFHEWGAAGWLLLGASYYWLLHRNDRQQRNAFGTLWLHAGALWTLAFLIAWESHWQVSLRSGGVWPALTWGLVPALLLALLGAKRPRPSWPIAEHLPTYRFHAAVPLAIAVCGWIVVINLSNRGDPFWLPYIPLFNPLDVTVGMCIAALGLWWTALSEAQRTRLFRNEERWLVAAIAAMIFLWLNAALIRSLHHLWDEPFTLEGIANSTRIQSSLSIFWGLLGFVAMTIAARRRWRYVWIVGASLMLVVVAKLFLVDLSNVGTVARIASFLTVGGLLLVTGYLAPLPPKKPSDAEVSADEVMK